MTVHWFCHARKFDIIEIFMDSVPLQQKRRFHFFFFYMYFEVNYDLIANHFLHFFRSLHFFTINFLQKSKIKKLDIFNFHCLHPNFGNVFRIHSRTD